MQITLNIANVLSIPVPKKVHDTATHIDVDMTRMSNDALLWAITNGLKSGLGDAVATADTSFDDIEAKLERIYNGTLGARESDPVNRVAKEIAERKAKAALAKAGRKVDADAVKGVVAKLRADETRWALIREEAQAQLDRESDLDLDIDV